MMHPVKIFTEHGTKMNKILKITGSVILLAALAAVVLAFTQPNEITRDTDAVTYKQNGTFSYATYLKPSTLFGGANKATYPSEVVNKIDFTFSFKPAGNTGSSTTIYTVLSNPGIWQKRTAVASTTTANGNLNLTFSINMDSIKNIFSGIEDQLKITGISRHLTIEAVVVSGDQTFTHDVEIELTDTLITVANNLTQGQLAGESAFTYGVTLKPNSVFDASMLVFPNASASVLAAAGDPILIRLADNMTMDYRYTFSSPQQVTNVTTDTRVTAALSAPDLWAKSFSLFSGQNGASFDLKLGVDLAAFNDLIDAVRTETGVSADSYKLDITAVTHVKGTSASGPIDEVFTQIMKGTISRNVLTWDKAMSATAEGAIKQQVTVPNDQKFMGLNLGNLRTWSLAVFILGGTVLVSGFMIRSPRAQHETSATEKKLAAIRKKYGSRIVDASGSTPTDCRSIALSSFEGLIAVADELGKPIVYFTPAGTPSTHCFFVVDGEISYQYSITEQ